MTRRAIYHRGRRDHAVLVDYTPLICTHNPLPAVLCVQCQPTVGRRVARHSAIHAGEERRMERQGSDGEALLSLIQLRPSCSPYLYWGSGEQLAADSPPGAV